MHVDHLVFAAGPDGLLAEAERLGDLFGCKFRDGGFHPRFGTRNHILPLQGDRYLELVEVLEHPAAEKAPFGQAVRARTALGGGWMGWVVSVDALAPIEQRLGREAVRGSRRFPDGRLLEWDQIGIRDLISDPQLPYFLSWRSHDDILPHALPGDGQLEAFVIAGDKAVVEQWLGESVDGAFDGVEITFVDPEPGGRTGIVSATFGFPTGSITL